MNYKHIDIVDIEKKIKRKIKEYYPNRNYKLRKIKKIQIRLRPPIFRCDLDGNKQLFVKIFPKTVDESVIEQRKSEYENYIPIQKTLDFFQDINAVVVEGVKGRKLSNILIIQSFPLLREFYKNQLNLYMTKIGNAIGNLQRLNTKRYERLGNLEIDPILREKIGNELFIKINNKLDDVKGLKIPVTRSFGDPAPHNILISKEEIYFIDLDYYKSFDFCFRDLLTFSVGLELSLNKLYFGAKLFQVLNDIFYRAYKERYPSQLDENLLKLLRLKEYCDYLACHENMKKYDFMGFISIKYLTKCIKKIDSEI